MSHRMYNPRGGPFPSGQRSVVTGQYGLGSQSGLDLGGARLGPDSMSTSRGGMMANQQMSFSLGQRQSQVSQDRESTIDMKIRGAREEVRLLTQMLQQQKDPDPRLRKDLMDEVLSPGGSGYATSTVLGRSDDLDWSGYKAPSKLFAAQSVGHSSTSTQLYQASGYGSGGGPSSLECQPLPERKPARYTSESASSILASFGLSSEDLELLSHYPDDQLTPDNLPFILRDIRMRKVKRNDPDMRTSSDHLTSEARHSKVIDYGHSSKFGFPDEKPHNYPHEHLTKESPKYGREVSGSSFSGVDTTKRQQKSSAAPAPDQVVLVSKLQQPSLLDSRPATQSLDMKAVKTVPGRLQTAISVPPPINRSPQIPSLLGVGPVPPMMSMVSASPELSWAESPYPPSSVTAGTAKRLPTPTMMNDYSAATPRIFPHTCSLCNIECIQIKDWIEHQNTNLHIESCRRLRKQYPDWKADAVPVGRSELKLDHHSPKRRTHSHSYSRSPSPKRHHGSSNRRQRSRSHSRSRSPRRYRSSRSRSRSRTPPRKVRAISPSYRRRSRTPPGRRSPVYGSSRRSPVRSSRRVSPRRSSPARQQRSSSSERLAKKLIQSSAQLSNVTSSSTLKAMVQSLAPALLAELAKKRNSSSSSQKSSGTRIRSSSPSSKRSESSKSSSSSVTKTSSSKSEKPKKPAGPGTSCLLRLKGIPHGITHQDLVTAIEPYGKIHTAILLKAIAEASVCMEKEEDAKALVNSKNFMLHGKTVKICMEKDAKDELRGAKPQKKSVTKRKEINTTKGTTSQVAKAKEASKISQPAKAKGVMEKTSQATKAKEASKAALAAKGKHPVKAKPSGHTPFVKKIVKKEIPWRKNIVEITGLPETGVTEDELSELAKPHGFVSKPVIAIAQHKAYLEMPNTEAAEAFVKAYAETPAKLQDKEMSIAMMRQPVDLNYTESLFRVLMGMEKLPPQEIATLPERLLTVDNVPSGPGAISEVENLIKRFGSYKQSLALSGRIIFEMNSAAVARAVYGRFLKFPCIIQNHSITVKLAKIPKVTDQTKKKPDPKGVKQAGKTGVKAQAKNRTHKDLTLTDNRPKTQTPTETEVSDGGAAAVVEVVTTNSENTSKEDATKIEANTEMETSEFTTIIPPTVNISGDGDSKVDASVMNGAYITDISQSEQIINQVDTQESESGEGLPPVTNENTENALMDTDKHDEIAPLDTTECTKKAPLDTTESTESANLGTPECAEKESLDTLECAERAPLDISECIERAPMDTPECAKETPMDTPECAKETPMNTPECAKETPIDTPECTEKARLDRHEYAEKGPLDTAVCAEETSLDTLECAERTPNNASVCLENTSMDVADLHVKPSLDSQTVSQVETVEVENMSMNENEEEISKGKDSSEMFTSAQGTRVDSSYDSGKCSITAAPVVEGIVAQNDPTPERDPTPETSMGGEGTQTTLKSQDTMAEDVSQLEDDLKMSEAVQSDILVYEQSQLSEMGRHQPVLPPSDDMTLDFPPVTQEILKALEAAVHQCRLQTSLRRAEGDARQNTDAEEKMAEKVTVQSVSVSEVPSTLSKPPHRAKKTVPADVQKTQVDKERRPQNFGTRSQRGKTESPESEPSSRYRSKDSPETWSSTTRHLRSSRSPTTASRKTRSDSSPVSKKSKEFEEEGRKSRSSGRNAHPSRSDSKTRKTEKPKEVEEMFEESFPFNLDEFVTVDEVGDETEEHSVLSSESSFKDKHEHEALSPCSISTSDSKSKQVKKPPAPSTPCSTRTPSVAVIEAQDAPGVSEKTEKEPVDLKPVAEVKDPEKPKEETQKMTEDDALSSDNLQEAVKCGSDEVEKVEFVPTEISTPEPSYKKKEEKSKAPKKPEEIAFSKKETTDCSDLLDPSPSNSSTPVVKKEIIQVSKTKELEIPAEHHSSISDSPTHEKETILAQNKASAIPELLSKDGLVTLDEVSEEEEEFPDEVEEEELLKRQAGENPEALLTVDEVGGDEADTEEEPLEKELQGLVTLDEIVEEDEDDEDSFNPETLVTLDEARGDDEEMDVREQDAHTSFEANAQHKPEESVSSSRVVEEPCDIEELRRMNFVTVDEVGDEEEEKQEEQVFQQNEDVSITRKAGMPKKRARQTPVRKSNRRRRGKKGKTSDELKEEPEIDTVEEPASTTDVSSLASSVPESVDKVLKTEMPNVKPEAPKDTSNTETDLSETELKSKVSTATEASSKELPKTTTPGPATEKRATVKEESKLRREAELNQEPESKRPCSKPSVSEDFILPPFSPDNPIGVNFVVPKTGFFCRLCSLFYGSEETAKKTHCSSLRHYQNMQKYYEKLKSQSASESST